MEMSIYPDHSGHRYTLRTDGFASVHAAYAPGEMHTHPFTFTGTELVLNMSTSAAGSIAVEIQDAQGVPLPGYAIVDCIEMIGDEIARPVAWKKGTNLYPLAGQPIRLRFVMKEADLFALQFRN